MQNLNIYYIVLFFLSTGCNKVLFPKSSFQINNESCCTISTFIATERLVGFTYPDTLLPENEISMQVAEPGKNNYYDFDITMEEVFNQLPLDTLSIFYFSTDTLNKYTWQEIRKNYMILRRDDLSIEDLEALKFIVRYR